MTKAPVLLIPQYLAVKRMYKNPVLTQSLRLDVTAALQYTLKLK